VRSRTEFQHLALGLIEGLLLVVLAGFLFALAARLPPSLRYRIWPPLLPGIVPFLMPAQFVAVFGSQWSAPKILLDQRFSLSPQAQFALAVMVGVALASGFGSEERSPEEHS
jgi:hypothetical protein